MSKLMTVSKVLQLKDRRKEALEIEAKRLKDMIELEDSKLDTLEKSLSDMIVTFREKQIGKVINLHEIGMFYDYAEKLNSEIKVQKVKINNFILELNDKEKALFEVYKEKKLFEKLRGKVIKEINRESSLSERKEMDSLFLSKWVRE